MSIVAGVEESAEVIHGQVYACGGWAGPLITQGLRPDLRLDTTPAKPRAQACQVRDPQEIDTTKLNCNEAWSH